MMGRWKPGKGLLKFEIAGIQDVSAGYQSIDRMPERRKHGIAEKWIALA